jgi:Putative zinc binding domain
LKCRHCGWPLEVQSLDLGVAPPSNAYLTAERLQAAELWLPLRLMVWQSCWLMQTLDYARSDTLSPKTTPTSVHSRHRGSTIRGQRSAARPRVSGFQE